MTQSEAIKDVNAPWREHCKNAVRKFVMNAVVIDNQPVLSNKSTPSLAAKTAEVVDDGMGGEPATPKPESQEVDSTGEAGTEESQDLSAHDLNIRVVSDAFAKEQIACAFVLPDDDEIDSDSKAQRIIAASRQSDMIVIDWYLQDKDPSLTLRVLEKIAEEDAKENGRLRLICVYTGQPSSFFEQITKDVVAAFKKGGLPPEKIDEKKGWAKGNNFCFLVLNKTEVQGEELPDKLLEAMTDLSEGLLPSFALAAVAAVRRNMHHIATRFSSDLDMAFVANRLITDPPGDVAELIRELFVSECDTALGLEKVADNYLEKNQISKWLDKHNQPKRRETYGGKKGNDISVDRAFIDGLLNKGIRQGKVEIEGVGEKSFKEDYRRKVTFGLHGSKEKAIESETDFSRFASLKREAFGSTKLLSQEGWVPSLSLGTVLRVDSEKPDEVPHKYYYCLTPACDTLRLQGEKRTFMMLELEEPDGNPNLIIKEIDAVKKLRIVPKPYNIRSFVFKGDDVTGRVQATPTDKDSNHSHFIFSTTDNEYEFLWLAEVRRNRANRDMADLNREWLRLGIYELEYLRLAGRKKADF
nr:response regulator receiver domain [uncultured Desulfuromonas sp.]